MACFGADGALVPCSGWSVYDSYVTDPLFASYFTIGWTCALALVLLTTLPALSRRLLALRPSWGLFGLYEDLTPGGYQALKEPAPVSTPKATYRLPTPVLALHALFNSISRTTLPIPSVLAPKPTSCHPTRPRLPFSLGTLSLALLLPILYLATLLPASQLRANPNRFGFLALASIPLLFVLSAKTGAVAWFTGRGWTGVNFLHRWMGRIVVLLVLLHFYFWTIQYIASARVTQFLAGDKEQRGIGALVCLLLIALSSSRPVRKYSYPIFFVLHCVGIIGFLVFVNRHTIYARGWATYAVLGIYGVDIAGRLVGMRVRYVEVEALEGGMTRVRMRALRGGWRAGKHLSLRLFFAPPSPSLFSAFRPFESHPFSISNAPPSTGVLSSSSNHGIDLFIRSCGRGTWTGDLFEKAQLGARVAAARNMNGGKQVLHMLAMVEGPYGGLGYEEMGQENVLLVAGGSGMSFVVGVLDECVGQRIKSGRGGKIEVVWAIRERSHIDWFEPSLHILLLSASSAPNLSLSLKIFITCDPSLTDDSASNPTSPPHALSLPHTQIIYARPHLSTLVAETVGAALAPCGNCYPVCRCGEGGDGICGNDEEECCGGAPANGRELLEKDGQEKEEEEVGELPKLLGGSCCRPSNEEEEDDMTVIPGPSACCAPRKEEGSGEVVPSSCGGGCCAGTGSGCCSGGIEGVGEKEEEGPVRVRTGGLGVAVCGPGSMIAELRNVLARVPLAKQARIGGIDLHEEHFSL